MRGDVFPFRATLVETDGPAGGEEVVVIGWSAGVVLVVDEARTLQEIRLDADHRIIAPDWLSPELGS